MRSFRTLLVTVGVTFSVLVGGTLPAQAAVPEGGLSEAVYNYIHRPEYLPGGNDWTCKPTAARPNPVVLVPGTFANLGANFTKLAPRLKNDGFCVFGLNYGMTALSNGRVGGLGPIVDSARELDAFVARVRTATGAAKVDIVGHSQGGNVPIYWMKRMGGAARTAHYVGLAPSSHGTDLNGIVTLAEDLDALGFINDASAYLGTRGVTDQMLTSAYTKALWADTNTVPTGPKYTVIMSRWDAVVTPYSSQRLAGTNVRNLVVQDYCWNDNIGHAGLAFDGPTLQLTLNALTDGPSWVWPVCWDYGPQWL
jgi:triacylglycerol lipase